MAGSFQIAGSSDRFVYKEYMLVEHSNQFFYMLSGFSKRFLLMARSLNFRLVKVTGTTQDGKQDFTFYYLGEIDTLGYFKKNFGGVAHEETLDKYPFWKLKEKLKPLSEHLVIIEANRLLDSYIPKGGFQTYPWIKQIVFFKKPAYETRKKKIEAIYGKKARLHQYRFEIRKDTKTVSKFYHELYVPYVSSKYKKVAHLRSLQEFQHAVKSGFLLQVFDRDQWISGSLCMQKGKTIAILAGGLAPDYDYHLKRGAMSTCDYFLFEWAKEHGFEVVDFLRSRPHKLDGLFEYKRKWGASAVKDVWPHTSLWIFVPKDMDTPEMLKGQLIWHNKEFIELEKIAYKSPM